MNDSLWTLKWYLDRNRVTEARAFLDKLLGIEIVTIKTETIGEAVAAIAESQIGIHEHGHNSGPEIVEYQKATRYPPGPWPWCAAFVCWVLQQAAKRVAVDWKRPKTPGAFDFEGWAWFAHRSGGRAKGVQLIKPPNISDARRGDIVVFSFSHIGLVVAASTDGKTITTVEGNTNKAGAREGDGVFRKTRKFSQVRSLIRLK